MCPHTIVFILLALLFGNTEGASINWNIDDNATADTFSGYILAQVDGGLWGTVCDTGYNQAVADAACRTVGYPDGAVAFFSGATTAVYEPIVTDVTCPSTMGTNLHQCTYTVLGGGACSSLAEVNCGDRLQTVTITRTETELTISKTASPSNKLTVTFRETATVTPTKSLWEFATVTFRETATVKQTKSLWEFATVTFRKTVSVTPSASKTRTRTHSYHEVATVNIAPSKTVFATNNVCLGPTVLCNKVHLIIGATPRTTCDDSLSMLNSSFTAIPKKLALNDSSLFVVSSSIIPATVSMYNLTSMADYRLISFIVNYQQSRNEVTVAAKDLTNETKVLGVRAFSNFTTIIDVAIKVLSLQWDEAIAKDTVMASGINVTFTESCGWPSNGSSYSRIVAVERPVVFVPRKVFERTSVNMNIASVNAALSLSVGAVAMPIAAVQQGVALSLVRMSQCDRDPLDGTILDPTIHPLRIGLGDGITKYARGAVLGNLLIIPCVWAVLWYLVASHVASAWRKQSLAASREFVGWPGVAIIPFSILSEGSAMACVALLFNTSNSALDAAMGSVGLALLLASIVAWARSLWLLSRLKSRSLECRPALPSQGILRLLKPRYEWLLVSRNSHIDASSLPPEDPLIAKQETNESDAIAASYLEGRLAFVGDSWWMWSQVAASTLSVAVGVAEGLSIADISHCKARWVFVSAAAILQGIVILTNTIATELAILGIICVVTLGLILTITLSTFDLTDFSGDTQYALNALGIANAVVGILLAVVGVVVSVLEAKAKANKRALATSVHSTTLATFWGGSQTFAKVTDQELMQLPTLLIESKSHVQWEGDNTLPPRADRDQDRTTFRASLQREFSL